MEKYKIPTIHCGEILFEEFLEPMGLTQNQLASEIKVSPHIIDEIVSGKAKITSDIYSARSQSVIL